MGVGSFSPQKILIIPFTRKRGVRVLKELALSGHTLQLTTEVRYPGLILNRGLTRKARLKNVIRHTGLFEPVRAHLVKLRVVHLICTMVIIPMLTYSSMVWWPRVG
jgi:hypothetical protein